MVIECLASDEIIFRGEKFAEMQIPRKKDASHYRIARRRFIQYRVNPTPTESLREFPERSRLAIICAEAHMHNIYYNISFR